MSITDIFVTETKTKTFAKIKSSQYAIRTCYHILKKLQLTRFQFLLRTECLIVSRESAMRHSAMYHLQCSVVFISNVQIHCRTSGNLTAKWCRRKLDIVLERTTTNISTVETNIAEDLVLWSVRQPPRRLSREFSPFVDCWLREIMIARQSHWKCVCVWNRREQSGFWDFWWLFLCKTDNTVLRENTVLYDVGLLWVSDMLRLFIGLMFYALNTENRTHRNLLILNKNSERELLYDDNIHVEASAYAHWTDLLIYTINIYGGPNLCT